jgi:hypothetical protein
MTLSAGRYPRGVLVWVVASTPGPALSLGGPFAGPSGTAHSERTTVPRYAFSVDFVSARTGHWLEGLEGS